MLISQICPGFHESVESSSKNKVVGAVREPPLDKNQQNIKKADHDEQFGYSSSQIDTVEGLRLFQGRGIFCDRLYAKTAMPLWRDYRWENGVE